MKKAIILVVASCGVGFYAGYLVVGNQLLKEHKAEMAKLQAAWEAEKASLDTDVKLLRAIISNLLGNSVEYAPAGSRIEVGFHAVDGGFELRIANPSNNLKPEDVPKLFDRFWRKDQARTASGHLGLGLSICKSFANLLGYELGATLSGSNILVMSLRGRFSNAA